MFDSFHGKFPGLLILVFFPHCPIIKISSFYSITSAEHQWSPMSILLIVHPLKGTILKYIHNFDLSVSSLSALSVLFNMWNEWKRWEISIKLNISMCNLKYLCQFPTISSFTPVLVFYMSPTQWIALLPFHKILANGI